LSVFKGTALLALPELIARFMSSVATSGWLSHHSGRSPTTASASGPSSACIACAAQVWWGHCGESGAPRGGRRERFRLTLIVYRSYRNAETKELFDTGSSRKFRNIERVALRKLIYLNRAQSLRDLAIPGHRLEMLTKDRPGQHSIRINDQFRICFTWKDGEAHDVEITDYH
jgi:toxin HigB-1